MSKYKNYRFITLVTILVISAMIIPINAQSDPDFVVVYAVPYDLYEYSQFTSQSYPTIQWLSIVSAGLYSRSATTDRNFDLELAYQFPASSLDGMTHEVVLKEDLRFSDGTALTADDVVFTYHSLLSPAINHNNYGFYTYYFDSNDSIRAINDQTIEFTLNVKWSGFMTLLSAAIQPRAHFADRNNEQEYIWNTDDGSDSISAGPFLIQTMDNIDMQIEMVKNQYYWNAENVVSDVIIFKKIGERATAISALESGEIQILDSQYVPNLHAFDELNNTVDLLVPGLSHQEFSLNHLHPYFGTGENLTVDDKVEGAKDVRKAISHIVDNDFAANDVMEGLARPLATIVPPSSFGWNSDIIHREFSVEKAKELMEQAGFNFDDLGTPDDHGFYTNYFFEISMLSPNTGPVRNQWNALLVQNLPLIGIGVKTHLSTDWATIIPRTFGSDIPPPIFDEGGFDIFGVGYGWDMHFDPSGLYESYNLRPDGGNFYNFVNNEYDELSEQLYESFDIEKRYDLMQQIQDFYFEWEIVIPVINPSNHWAFTADLRGYDGVLLTNAQAEWDKIGTQEALDALKPFGSFLDFDLFSLIIPFLILSVFSYSIKNKTFR